MGTIKLKKINLDNIKNKAEKMVPLSEQSEEYRKIVNEADRRIEEARDREGKAYIKAKHFIAR